MMVRTSAKSRLIRLGRVMVSTTPLTISAMSWSMMLKASSRGRFGTKCRSLLLSRTSTASAAFRSNSNPSSARCILCLRSTEKGVVTMATTRAPERLASSETIGAMPVPVPPPRPAVTKTRSAPLTILAMTSRPASAQRLPVTGSPPAPRPLVMCLPISSFCIALVWSRCCLSVLIATVTAPSTPMWVIRFIVLLPEPPQPQTRMRGSGGPKDSSSRSVRAVGILPSGIWSIADAGASVIRLTPVHPRHRCLRSRSAFLGLLNFEGSEGVIEAIIQGSPESEIRRGSLHWHGRA